MISIYCLDWEEPQKSIGGMSDIILKRDDVGGEIPCCPHVRQAAAPPPRHSTSHPGWSAGGAARRS